MANILTLWLIAACALLFGAGTWYGTKWYAIRVRMQRGDALCDAAGVLGAIFGAGVGVVAVCIFT